MTVAHTRTDLALQEIIAEAQTCFEAEKVIASNTMLPTTCVLRLWQVAAL
jgi:hypothetical protein